MFFHNNQRNQPQSKRCYAMSSSVATCSITWTPDSWAPIENSSKFGAHIGYCGPAQTIFWNTAVSAEIYNIGLA